MRFGRGASGALALVLALTLAADARAQQPHDPLRVWAAGGLATGFSRNIEAGFGLVVELAAQKPPHYASVRGLFLGDFAGFPDSGGGDAVAEGGVTYGRTRRWGAGQASVSAGLSGMRFEGCPGGRRDSCYALGIPIVAEAALSAKVIGLGVQGFLNLNHRAPYGGVVLFLQLGWLP